MSRRKAALGDEMVTFRHTIFYETLDYLTRNIKQVVEKIIGLNLDMKKCHSLFF